MHWVLTSLQLLSVVVGVWLLMRSADAVASVNHEVHRLRQMIGRLTALEASHESLYTQHRKLAGKFHAQRWAQEQEQEQPDYEEARVAVDTATCDNYRLAQIEGPSSRAAKCECALCVRAREARNELRRRAGIPMRATVASSENGE